MRKRRRLGCVDRESPGFLARVRPGREDRPMRRVSSAAALTPRGIRARLLDGADHYDELVQKAIGSAKVSLWIATANVKEMRVEAPIGTVARARGRYISILDTLDGLASRGVELRMLHAGTPSRPFREE